MYSQRVEILHITYSDTVVITVSYNLILYFLPSLQAFLNKNLGRERERFLCMTIQLILIVTEATAQTT